MSRKLCIFGSGGFAKEVFWLAKQCCKEVAAFIDIKSGDYLCDGIKIQDENYFDPMQHIAIVAIGNPQIRSRVVAQIIERHKNVQFATLIAPTANLMADSIRIGQGSIICANCIITCDVELSNHTQLNLATTIGHDTKIGDFFTASPQSVISGNVKIGNCVYFGNNSSVNEHINICDNVTIGASACITKDIVESGTYVGVPAKKLEKK